MTYQKKSPEEIRKIMEKNETNIIDVRSSPERSDGYIQNSTCMDVRGLDFEMKLTKLDKNKILIIYCHAGNRAMAAASKADSLGFKKVYMIDGGIVAWKKCKFPTEK